MKNFLTSCLGTIVGLIVFILILLAFLVGSVSSDNEILVSEKSVLAIKLDKRITELELEEPLAEVFPGSVDESLGLIQLKEAIHQAKEDSKIQGIYLNAPFVLSGFATLQELREELQDFKSSGKWIIAYADFYTEGGYYLSSVADKVYMNPVGQFELNGLEAEVQFFKKLFDKLEIKPQVFRVGDFKSAVEPFLRDDMSPENKLQLTELINGIYSDVVEGIAASRNLDAVRVQEIADKMLVREPQQAVEFGLIDSLYYDDQVKAEIKERLGISRSSSIEFVKYSDYRKTVSLPSTSKNEIAVIVADGDILPGKGDNGVVGSVTIREEIRKARTSDRVKAIIIRVNSPGGAFTAADEMWREVYLASQEKPVIASMGDYAASGGYYLAMACDTIVAQPSTITGSIGVFSVLFDLSSFLGDKLGITSDQVRTGEVGDLITVTRPLTETEKAIWQKQTDEVYDIFTSKAAEGRNMSQNDIKKVASGRVWTGSQAVDRGLVDLLGSFDDAVKIAADKANIGDDYKLRYYPRQKTFFQRLMNESEDYVSETVMKNEAGEYYELFQRWDKVKNYQGSQTRIPFEFSLH
jgi:protease IV